jgi:hypothetical protein
MGIIARAIVDVFSRIDSVADSAGTPSVFLAAYDTLGKNLSPNLDVARLAEAGVDVRLLRHVEIAPHQKSLSVNVTSAVSALAVLQTIASTRNHALKVNPKVGAPVLPGTLQSASPCVKTLVSPQLATAKHFLVTLRVEWPAGEVFLAHFADVAALEDTWTKDCYGQHKHEWRTTCTRDPGPTLPPHELKNLITRNSDLVCMCVVLCCCVKSIAAWLVVETPTAAFRAHGASTPHEGAIHPVKVVYIVCGAGTCVYSFRTSSVVVDDVSVSR